MTTNSRCSAIESRIKLKLELQKGFQSDAAVEKMLESIEKMVSASLFTRSELLDYCWSIIKKILQSNQFLNLNPQQVIKFGLSAMTVLNNNNNNQISIACFGSEVNIDNTRRHGPSLFAACVSYLLATAYHELNMNGESLRYLNAADFRLSELEKDDNSRCLKNCVRRVLICIQHKLDKARVSLGKRYEAVVQARKVLERMELTMDGNSIELCKAYTASYEAYAATLDIDRALPFCQKALDICIRCHGESMEVARLRFDLAVLYNVVGESNKAAHEKKLAQSVLMDDRSVFSKASFKGATMLFNFGEYKEAIDTLELLIKRNVMEAHGRVFAFLTMAKASYKLGKFVDAGKYMTDAKSDLKDVDAIIASKLYLDMSDMYESMDELGSAISSLKTVTEISVRSQEIDTEGRRKIFYQKLLAGSCIRLFRLISRPGMAKEEKLFLIDVAEKLEQIVSREHIAVGYICAKFGESLRKSGQADLALKVFKKAKDILEVALGPHHVDLLKTSHNLSESYAILGRYNEAVRLQVKVVEETKGLGPSEQQFKDNAVTLLNKLKKNVARPLLIEPRPSPKRVKTSL